MGIIYRTTTTPNAAATSIKGSSLTHAQLDGNLAFISSSYIASDVTSSMSVSSATTSTRVTSATYPNGAGPVPLNLNLIGGSATTNGGAPSLAVVNIAQLSSNTLGTNCFITATATGSIPGVGSQAIHVVSLVGGVVTFASEGGQVVPFTFHILHS